MKPKQSRVTIRLEFMGQRSDLGQSLVSIIVELTEWGGGVTCPGMSLEGSSKRRVQVKGEVWQFQCGQMEEQICH